VHSEKSAPHLEYLASEIDDRERGVESSGAGGNEVLVIDGEIVPYLETLEG